jgi:hypothetical protein
MVLVVTVPSLLTPALQGFMLNGVLALLAPALGHKIPIHVGTNAFLMPRLQEVMCSNAHPRLVLRLSLVLVKYGARIYFIKESPTAPGIRGLFIFVLSQLLKRYGIIFSAS